MALAAAIFTLLGVITSIHGTYLMTLAFHPFEDKDVFLNFSRVMFRFATLRWKSAKRMTKKAAFFGEMNKEDRSQSLTGLYVLAFSFVLQTAGAGFAIADAIRSSHEHTNTIQNRQITLPSEQ